MNSKKNKKLELILQKRASKRSYVFDYHAFIRDVENKKVDLFSQGGGISINLENAKKRAIGEAIERYCGSHINNKVIRSSFDSAKNAINPKKLIYFSDYQYCNEFSYKKFNTKITIDWITGLSLTKKKKILVPAFAVYLGYNRLVSKKFHFMPSSSNGLASHTSIKKAEYNAILELIERDSAMRVWLFKKKVTRLDINSVPSNDLLQLKNNILKEDLKIEVCITPNNFSVISVIAIIYNNKKKTPYASFGMAAGSKIENVVIKALEEAVMVRNTLEILKNKNKINSIKESSIKQFIDHAIYYSFPSQRKKWNFLLNGPVISVKQLSTNYCKNINHEDLIAIFKKNKQEIISIDLTTETTKKMGVHSIKIIAPSLYPMDSNHGNYFLHNPAKTSIKINKDVHPFP